MFIQVVELDGREVITSALYLVARLEHDRQETLKLLAEEKLKVKRLRGKLDQEHERRLDMLPKLVQAGECVSHYRKKFCYQDFQ